MGSLVKEWAPEWGPEEGNPSGLLSRLLLLELPGKRLKAAPPMGLTLCPFFFQPMDLSACPYQFPWILDPECFQLYPAERSEGEVSKLRSYPQICVPSIPPPAPPPWSGPLC